jgi:hypothetical protein
MESKTVWMVAGIGGVLVVLFLLFRSSGQSQASLLNQQRLLYSQPSQAQQDIGLGIGAVNAISNLVGAFGNNSGGSNDPGLNDYYYGSNDPGFD